MTNWMNRQVELTQEQEQKLEAIYIDLSSEGPLTVSTARTAEGEYRVMVRTPGMVKFSWEDEFCVPWQGWMAADGEVIRVFSFAEADEEEDADWVLQDGICAVMNRLKVGA